MSRSLNRSLSLHVWTILHANDHHSSALLVFRLSREGPWSSLHYRVFCRWASDHCACLRSWSGCTLDRLFRDDRSDWAIETHETILGPSSQTSPLQCRPFHHLYSYCFEISSSDIWAICAYSHCSLSWLRLDQSLTVSARFAHSRTLLSSRVPASQRTRCQDSRFASRTGQLLSS